MKHIHILITNDQNDDMGDFGPMTYSAAKHWLEGVYRRKSSRQRAITLVEYEEGSHLITIENDRNSITGLRRNTWMAFSIWGWGIGKGIKALNNSMPKQEVKPVGLIDTLVNGVKEDLPADNCTPEEFKAWSDRVFGL